jgi:hypothetical protein
VSQWGAGQNAAAGLGRDARVEARAVERGEWRKRDA